MVSAAAAQPSSSSVLIAEIRIWASLSASNHTPYAMLSRSKKHLRLYLWLSSQKIGQISKSFLTNFFSFVGLVLSRGLSVVDVMGLGASGMLTAVSSSTPTVGGVIITAVSSALEVFLSLSAVSSMSASASPSSRATSLPSGCSGEDRSKGLCVLYWLCLWIDLICILTIIGLFWCDNWLPPALLKLWPGFTRLAVVESLSRTMRIGSPSSLGKTTVGVAALKPQFGMRVSIKFWWFRSSSCFSWSFSLVMPALSFLSDDGTRETTTALTDPWTISNLKWQPYSFTSVKGPAWKVKAQFRNNPLLSLSISIGVFDNQIEASARDRKNELNLCCQSPLEKE